MTIRGEEKCQPPVERRQDLIKVKATKHLFEGLVELFGSVVDSGVDLGPNTGDEFLADTVRRNEGFALNSSHDRGGGS